MTNFYPGSLHNHTQYSNLRLRDCIIKEDDLIKYAVELGHEVVAITDHEAVCNAVKVEKIYKKIKKDNPDFKVVLGNEIYLCRNGLNADNFNKDFAMFYEGYTYVEGDEAGELTLAVDLADTSYEEGAYWSTAGWSDTAPDEGGDAS